MGQGSGYFPYPASSFMISESRWIYYGGAHSGRRARSDRHRPTLIAGAALQRVRAAASVTIL